MLLCKDHTAELRAALDARALGGFISEDQGELNRRLDRERIFGPSTDSFDPLYTASWNVMNNCLQVAQANGELGLHRIIGCHLCYVKSRWPTASVYSMWMDAAADGMVAKYRRLVALEAR